MKRILLVDDNKYLLDGLSGHLRAQLSQCLTMTAANGGNALEILEVTAIDFLLTDLQMPVMDGYELLTRIKDRFPHIPVYAMTCDNSPSVEQRACSLGARQCIPKPLGFEFEKITMLISGVLNAATNGNF